MRVQLSVSRWSKLDYVLGSIVATVLGHKIRPTDAIYESGSHSCYATAAKELKKLDPTLSSSELRIICFAQPGVTDEPQHCLLAKGYEVLTSTWVGDFHRLRDGKGTITAMEYHGELYNVVADFTAKELEKMYG